MSILETLNSVIGELGIPVETGEYSEKVPPVYVVLTPLVDSYELFSDNKPQAETEEVRVSLFNYGNYIENKNKICEAILDADLIITNRRHIGFDRETGYHNYAVDVASIITKEEIE